MKVYCGEGAAQKRKGIYFPYNMAVFKMLYVCALFMFFFKLVVLSCVNGATDSLRGSVEEMGTYSKLEHSALDHDASKIIKMNIYNFTNFCYNLMLLMTNHS